MRQAVKISVDGITEVVDLDAAGGSLKALQAAVGGWVEAIDLNDEVTMWCNEEGKITGLEPNPFATLLYRSTFDTSDWVAGNVIFTGGVDAEGETLGLTDELVAKYSELRYLW